MYVTISPTLALTHVTVSPTLALTSVTISPILALTHVTVSPTHATVSPTLALTHVTVSPPFALTPVNVSPTLVLTPSAQHMHGLLPSDGQYTICINTCYCQPNTCNVRAAQRYCDILFVSCFILVPRKNKRHTSFRHSKISNVAHLK